MTDQERITALEARIAQLEERIARQEDPRRGVWPSPAWDDAINAPQVRPFDWTQYHPYRGWKPGDVFCKASEPSTS